MADALGVLEDRSGCQLTPDQRSGPLTKADIEWDRFESVCIPMPGGGLRDPSEPILRRGVSAREWDSLFATQERLRQRRERLN